MARIRIAEILVGFLLAGFLGVFGAQGASDSSTYGNSRSQHALALALIRPDHAPQPHLDCILKDEILDEEESRDENEDDLNDRGPAGQWSLSLALGGFPPHPLGPVLVSPLGPDLPAECRIETRGILRRSSRLRF